MKKKIVKHVKKTKRKLIDRRKGKSNLNMFFTFVALIMIWRGIWLLLDKYFIPDLYLLNAVIPIILGVVFLLIDDKSLSELTK
jgi:hypothetical protein